MAKIAWEEIGIREGQYIARTLDDHVNVIHQYQY